MRIIEPGSREILGEPDGYDPPPGVPVDGSKSAQIAVDVELTAVTPWRPATWTAGRLRSTQTYGAVGSGANNELAGELQRVWLRVSDNPDRPVTRVDTLWVKPFAATGEGIGLADEAGDQLTTESGDLLLVEA